ncbi:mucin-17-like isoform X2 [Salvia splendens]|uniref:mucin-17-like isoform X2 n=1 Tax=Salvia splendens TaxID=180675 RepID=UPI001C27528F|nr:mucin-17-like isoform X2 [Salvia splendens]
MDVQGYKITVTSAGHEGHGVHHCHKCGWPFPNPHPSSKHRRAHKRVCGTIEGYKIIHSEEHDKYLAFSDDDHASDDDEHQSPDIVKRNAFISGGVGAKSNKSEDDVFSDAPMEFSDSGISPQLEAPVENVGEMGKSLEHKGLEGDVYGSGVLGIKEAAETIEQPNDATSEEISKPRPLSNGSSLLDNAMPIKDTAAETVSVGPSYDSHPERGLQGDVLHGPDTNIQVQEHDSASVSLDPEERNVLDQTIAAGKSQDESCDKFISEGAKNDSPPISESLQMDAPDAVNSVVHSVEKGTSIKTSEVALVDETCKSVDASALEKELSHSSEVEKVLSHSTEAALVDETRKSIDASAVEKELSHSTEDIGSSKSVYGSTLPEESLLNTSLVEPNESTLALDVTEHSDVACTVSSIDKEEMPKTTSDASDGEKSDMTSGYKCQNRSLESKHLNSLEANSAPGSTVNAIPCEDTNITMGKKGMDHCVESTNITNLETGNEKDEGVSAEVEVIPDSTLPSEKLADLPSSCVADGYAKSSQELSENNSSSLEFKDDGFENSIRGDGADGPAGADSEANEIGDMSSSVEHPVLPVSSEMQNTVHVATNVVEVEPLDVSESVTKIEDGNAVLVSGSEANEIGDRSSLLISSVEHPVSLLTSELQNNVHAATNVVQVEPVDVAETVSKLDDNAVSVSAETPEHSISTESTLPLSDSVSLREIGDRNSSLNSSVEHPVPLLTSVLQNNVHALTNVVKVEPLDVTETVSKVEDDDAFSVSAETPEHSISTESTLPLSAKDGTCDEEDFKASESITNTEVTSDAGSRETSESPTPSVQGTFPVSTCLKVTSSDVKQMHSSDDLSTLKSVNTIPGAEHSFDDKVLKSEECFGSSEAPSLKQPVASASDVEEFHGISDTVDDKSVVIVEDVTRVDAKYVNTEAECKPAKQTDDASAVDVSSSLASPSDSLEANCGSVVSDTFETNSQKHKTRSSKSDTFEPPSFMTLVQSGSEVDQGTAATEIETVQNNQQQRSDALEAVWFPSLTNVVNESEGRKKNEEMIAKVTNWSPVKQQSSPLKSLLNEVKSPNTKQVPLANQKVEAETEDGNVGKVVTSETHKTKDSDTNKHLEEWNSPARYPIEIKKEKKKGRPFWVPFVCCSSAHRDL